MKNATSILNEFHMNIANGRCAFELKSGHHYEGYIFEVEDSCLCFGDSGPFADDEDLFIPVEDVDLSTLAYWDEDKRCYMDAQWNDERDKWIFKPSEPSSEYEIAPTKNRGPLHSILVRFLGSSSKRL